MPAAATAQISELTLSWINDQLRRELLRRLAEEAPAPLSRTHLWQQQMIAAVSGLLSGLCFVVNTTFA